MLKIIAILANSGLLGFSLYASITEGFYGNGWDILGILLAFFLFPIINIAAILQKDKDNWIILYFKRKALQEKRKIEEIENGMKK